MQLSPTREPWERGGRGQIIMIIITFTFIAPFPLLSNGALQQQLFFKEK